MSDLTRRSFCRQSVGALGGLGGLSALGLALPSCAKPSETSHSPGPGAGAEENPLFSISLAQWSLHRALRDGDIDNLDFAPMTRRKFELDAVEYVNSFFKDKAKDEAYLAQMKKAADDAGVKSLLIMVDGEGAIGDPDEGQRTKAVENHYRWIDAAAYLGCHSIRVNAQSSGSVDEQRTLAIDGLTRLTEHGAKQNINVIVENHGGLSSNGQWLASVIKGVELPTCGTLPDFGNFKTGPDEWYDRYQGVTELMPFAKAVSAKSHEFNEKGAETGTDFRKMMKIVLDAGYKGYVGIEYEGQKHSEMDGIRLTKQLLETIRAEMTTAVGG